MLIKRRLQAKEIAKVINRSESTICRELKRNINKRGKHAGKYCAKRAQAKADNRHKQKPKHNRLTEFHLKYIREKLKDDKWSPEYISERGKLLYGDFVSHETIYNYIWMCKASNKKKYSNDKDLDTYLRHHKRRIKRL